MLQQEQPDDYVIATGETHSVKEFVEATFDSLGLDWHDHVVVDPTFYRPAEVGVCSVGDASKAKTILGWQPRTTFKDLVEVMVKADVLAVG